MSNWKPSANLSALRARARLNQAIRDFFVARNVLEVETPLLCQSTATDPHLTSFELTWQGRAHYLQTSPEFPMKRLLAAGSGPIFQLCKAFRADEVGRIHNPEFTLLEWYRPGFSLQDLMSETEALVRHLASLFGCTEALVAQRLTYREAFMNALGIDPLLASDATLAAVAREHIEGAPQDWDRDGWLNLLMSQVVEPSLPHGMTFVWGFPPSQASLARCLPDMDGVPIAARVELYLGGMELANGYHELIDADEQRQRCRADIAQRQVSGLSPVPEPELLLGALHAGMPDCAGIALGVDRLLMWLLEAGAIAEVCAFTTDRA